MKNSLQQKKEILQERILCKTVSASLWIKLENWKIDYRSMCKRIFEYTLPEPKAVSVILLPLATLTGKTLNIIYHQKINIDD